MLSLLLQLQKSEPPIGGKTTAVSNADVSIDVRGKYLHNVLRL